MQCFFEIFGNAGREISRVVMCFGIMIVSAIVDFQIKCKHPRRVCFTLWISVLYPRCRTKTLIYNNKEGGFDRGKHKYLCKLIVGKRFVYDIRSLQ